MTDWHVALALIAGVAIGYVLAVLLRRQSRGFLRKVDGCAPRWRVDSVAEQALDALADSMMTDAQVRAARDAVRSLHVTTIAHAFVPGRFELSGASGIAIGGSFRRAWLEVGPGWEVRLSRLVVHVAKQAVFGDPDEHAKDPTWFAAARSPWMRRERERADAALA